LSYRDKFLEKFKLSEELCTYRRHQNCDKKKYYRTPTGVCNNLERPYEGSAQTAFARLLPALYEDRMLKNHVEFFLFSLICFYFKRS